MDNIRIGRLREERQIDPGKAEILLVEDDPHSVELILFSLAERNLENRIYPAADGREGLSFIFGEGAFSSSRDVARPPVVVLLDVDLPNLNGLEFLSIIKSDERTRTIPIVMFTSSLSEERIKESYRLGANSYVYKSADFTDFNNTLISTCHYWLFVNRLWTTDLSQDRCP